jgi:DNA replication licensing factor MCM7
MEVDSWLLSGLALIISSLWGAQNDADLSFVERVCTNAKRYMGLFADAIDDLLPKLNVFLAQDEDFDVFLSQFIEEVLNQMDVVDSQHKLPVKIKRHL